MEGDKGPAGDEGEPGKEVCHNYYNCIIVIYLFLGCNW